MVCCKYPHQPNSKGPGTERPRRQGGSGRSFVSRFLGLACLAMAGVKALRIGHGVVALYSIAEGSDANLRIDQILQTVEWWADIRRAHRVAASPQIEVGRSS